jgi:hypothetical protein
LSLSQPISYKKYSSLSLLFQTSTLPSSHKLLHQAFLSRRKLILGHVFETQILSQSPIPPFPPATIQNANIIIAKCTGSRTQAGVEDAVAFQEALWPHIAISLPSTQSIRWAQSLIHNYGSLNRNSEALTFAESTWKLLSAKDCGLTESGSKPSVAIQHFARGLVTRLWSELKFDLAIDIQKQLHSRFSLRDLEFSTWGQDIVKSYRSLNRTQDAIDFEKRIYQFSIRHTGRSSKTTLEWARHLVREYTLAGDDVSALNLQGEVLRDMRPSTNEYVAWARQLITMPKRSNQHKQALAVKADVFRRLTRGDKVYYDWACEVFFSEFATSIADSYELGD